MAKPERSEADQPVATPEPEASASPGSAPGAHGDPSERSREGEDTASEPLAARRSSLRPAPPDWQPPVQHRVPSPMVVVYSGESERPPPLWDSTPSDRPTRTDFRPAAPTQPLEPAEKLPASRVSEPEAPAPLPGTISEWKRRARPFLLLGVLGLVGGVLALQFHREPPASRSLEQTPATLVTSAEVKKGRDPPARESVRARPEAAAPASSTSPVANTWAAGPTPAEGVPARTRVTVRVYPPDSVVVRRGRRMAGPPYWVDVPKGKRIAIEVARPGFVTRRAVLDGSEPSVWVGLVMKNSGRSTRPHPTLSEAPAQD